MISRLTHCCTTCLTILLAVPCMCCAMLTGAIAGFEDGRDAASSILDYDFEEETVEIEFIDEPPIAPVPGGASEWSTWVVLELGDVQATEFERLMGSTDEWHRMPLPEELLARSELLQPPEYLGGIQVQEKLPLSNANGYYLFEGAIENLRFHIAIYDPESRRIYVRAVSY